MADHTSPGVGPGLRKAITLRHAVAIYISSVLGAGVLVIPGLAAKAAGPASLLAWAFLSVASYPFAYTFASLSARRPDSGGIYSFAVEGFGTEISTMTAWLFIVWVMMGAPAITLAAGSYLAFAFPLQRSQVFLVAVAIILLAYAINLRGIKMTGRVQVAVVAMIIALLSLGVLAVSPKLSAGNFQPFLPSGVTSIGVASALIVWSYLGYENASNVAEEFENPQRDFRRSVVYSVLLIGALYLAVAFAIVGTGAYRSGTGVTPFAVMLASAFGPYAGVLVSVMALVIIFGTVNAYTAGMGRVVYAAARSGSLPKLLAPIDQKTGVPRRSLLALLALILLSLVVYYVFDLDIESGFLATSGAAVLVYVVGSAAGVKLLKQKGASRALPWASLLVSLAILPFIGPPLLPTVVVAALGLAYGVVVKRRAQRPARPAS